MNRALITSAVIAVSMFSAPAFAAVHTGSHFDSPSMGPSPSPPPPRPAPSPKPPRPPSPGPNP